MIATISCLIDYLLFIEKHFYFRFRTTRIWKVSSPKIQINLSDNSLANSQYGNWHEIHLSALIFDQNQFDSLGCYFSTSTWFIYKFCCGSLHLYWEGNWLFLPFFSRQSRWWLITRISSQHNGKLQHVNCCH